ncbi:MAG TPA: ABC transporter substrate-binding protein [Cerasibacillus sp.]|uniref:ABC transporter substrate-binding protein n=1 Tax=Cerasibacillus sp. TaxID=2498711 RepID=UPI002F402F58
MRKRIIILCMLLMSLIMLGACGNSEDKAGGSSNGGSSKKGKTFKIGATQIVEHPSLDQAYKGFQEALKDAGLDVEFDLQSAQGEQNNVKPIADNFVADSVDLIFANSTASTLGALQATDQIPIVFTSVSDPVGAGIVEAMDQPGDNITGVVDLHPEAIKETVQFIDKYFNGANVGLIYNAGEQNSVSQIDTVKEAAEGTSLTLTERTVANTSEVQQATMTIASEVDVLYIVTDNMVVSALDSVVGVAEDQKIPLIVGEPDSLEKGGFATFGIDYIKIGYRTGEMAVEILKGEKDPSDIPVEYPEEIKLIINKEAAEKQGVKWHDEWDELAEFLETNE